MDKFYREATTKMETSGVQPDYIIGWQGGYLGHPEREEQRSSDAYAAGYKDGSEKCLDNLSSWLKS